MLVCERCGRNVKVVDKYCPTCGLHLDEMTEVSFNACIPVMTIDIENGQLHTVIDGVSVFFLPGIPKNPKYEGKFKGKLMTPDEIRSNALEVQRRSNSFTAYQWLVNNFDARFV